MLQVKSFNTGTLTINYAQGPEAGPPLFLIHGGSSRWQEFLGLIPGLMLRWQVFALDMRGHGKSAAPPPGRYGVIDMAEDVNSFIKFLGQPVVIYGHSMGGYIGLSVAAANPSQVRALVIGDTPLALEHVLEIMAGTRPTWQEYAELTRTCSTISQLGRELYRMTRETFPDFDQAAARFTAKNWKMAANLLDPFQPDYFAGYDPESLLGQVRCPTLLLQADPARNALMNNADVTMASNRLADPVHVCLEGIGHGLHVEQPQRVLQVLNNFLESLD